MNTYLKSELVTGYLSILKLSTFTALSGDSPSRPSAAFVPIFRFPPGTITILSSAGAKENTAKIGNMFKSKLKKYIVFQEAYK